ncbi:MAG: alpha/beta fold hydrolase, partial [Solirubrobacteraceae bacterium]
DGAGRQAPAAVTDSGSARLRVAGAPIRETALRLATTTAPVFAIIAEPREREPVPLTAVLLNAGSVSHAGPNRAWVELARRWAARGVSTVRVDLPGIGESPGDAAAYRDTNYYYDAALTEQTIAILDALADRGLPPNFALAGLCSGSYWALHAALSDSRVCGAMLLNLWTFYFSPELVVERAPGDALARLRHGGLRRLVRGDFSRERLMRALRSIEPGQLASGAKHPIERSQSARIEADLDRLDARGVALTLLFGTGEPLRLQLERQGVIGDLARWPSLQVEQIPSRDHMFRSLALQHHVHAALDEALHRSIRRANELDNGHGGVAVATA